MTLFSHHLLDQLDGNGTVVPVSIPLELFSGIDGTTDVSSPLQMHHDFKQPFNFDQPKTQYSVGPNNVFVVDNFGLTTSAAAVPEPSSATLLVAGAVCLFSRRRRTA